MINEQDAKHAGKPAVDPETLQWEGRLHGKRGARAYVGGLRVLPLMRSRVSARSTVPKGRRPPCRPVAVSATAENVRYSRQCGGSSTATQAAPPSALSTFFT